MNASDLQPVQKGKVLPPEIHKAIQKWSNSFFRPSIPTNLIDKSVITEINDERAKLLTAQFLYGERNGTEKEIPRDDSKITNDTSNLNEQSLWLYGGGLSKAPSGFSERSQDDFRIPTGKTKKCSKCKGSGEVNCFFCKGTGKNQDNKSKECAFCHGSGKKCCKNCDGYKYVQVVIEVKTRFKVKETKEHDYEGEVPPKKIKSASGSAIFEQVAYYPEDTMKEVLKGGINPEEYMNLQSKIAMEYHSLIKTKLESYDGDINLVHELVDKFLNQIPNAFKENRILVHEIVPVRIKIKVEDAPVKKVSYTYKNKFYSLWVYGNEGKVYEKSARLGSLQDWSSHG